MAAASACRQRSDSARDLVEITQVRRAVARAAARFRLRRSDAEELHGDLWVRLLANDGHALRSYRGKATLETYLTTVASNLVLDRRRKTNGKWRPSARARRGGPAAVELDRLISREGVDAAIATERVLARWPEANRPALAVVAEAAAPRPRRLDVGCEALHDRPCAGPSPFDLLDARESARAAGALGPALTAALLSLDARDRDLVIGRYVEGRTVADLATSAGLDQKVLYRRFDQLVQRLRHRLESRGFGSHEAAAAVETGAPVRCALLRRGAATPVEGRAPLLRLVRTNGR